MPGFLMTLLAAVLTGWIGSALTGDNMPAGFWGAMLAGLVGAWIGAYMPVFNAVGPAIWGVAIIPTILGAAVSVFALGLSKPILKQAK